MAGASLLLIDSCPHLSVAWWCHQSSFLPFPSSLCSSILSTEAKIISDTEMKSAAKPHQAPMFLPSPPPAKPFSRADRKHFSLMTALCHSDTPRLATDMITERVRQCVCVWCWRFVVGSQGWEEGGRLALGDPGCWVFSSSVHLSLTG